MAKYLTCTTPLQRTVLTLIGFSVLHSHELRKCNGVGVGIRGCVHRNYRGRNGNGGRCGEYGLDYLKDMIDMLQDKGKLRGVNVVLNVECGSDGICMSKVTDSLDDLIRDQSSHSKIYISFISPECAMSISSPV